MPLPNNLRRKADKVRRNWRLTLPPIPKLIDYEPILAARNPGLKRFDEAMDEWKRNAEANIRSAIEQAVEYTADTSTRG